MRFRSIFALLLVIGASACTSWQRQPAPAPQVAAAQGGRPVRLVLRNHATFEVRNAMVVGDSVVGFANDPPQRFAVAMADLERIDARKVSGARTAGVAAGTYAVVVLVLAGLIAALIGPLTGD